MIRMGNYSYHCFSNKHNKSISISWEIYIERILIILIAINYRRLCSQDHYALIIVSDYDKTF